MAFCQIVLKQDLVDKIPPSSNPNPNDPIPIPESDPTPQVTEHIIQIVQVLVELQQLRYLVIAM